MHLPLSPIGLLKRETGASVRLDGCSCFFVSLILFTHLPFRTEPLIGAFGQDDPAREGLDGGGDDVAGGALAVGGGYDGARPSTGRRVTVLARRWKK